MRTASLLGILGIVLALAGCAAEAGGFSRAEGRVTDTGGAQPQSLGGAGTAAATTSVRASAVTAGGSLELVGEAEVMADTRYSIELPAHQEGLVLQAVDASGEVLAGAILDASGAVGETVHVTPMDSESSLEAAVYVAMIAQGASATEVSTVDLRARITSELALAVRMADDRGEDVSAAIDALALAVLAAQRTEVAMYAQAGVRVSQADLFAAEVSASTSLSSALHGGASASSSYDVFFAALAEAASELRVTAEEQARAEAAASASFRAVVRARLSSESSASIRDAAILAAASLEARVHERALASVLAAGDASAELEARAASATAELRARIGAASTVSAAGSAYAELAIALRGDADVRGSILGTYLGVDLVSALTVQPAVEASATAAAQLDAALDAAMQASLSGSGSIDTRMLAMQIAAAYGQHAEAIAAQRATLGTLASDARLECAIDLLVLADGSFRS